MEEINIRDLLIYFKTKLIFLIFIVLVVTGIGVSYKIFFEKPIYESSTSLILTGFSNGTETENTINNNDLTINSKLLATYQQITKSRKVLLQVIEELNLDYEVSALAKNIQVTGVTDTEIIQIIVKDTDANRAYEIVSKLAQVFSNEVREIYNVSNVSMLDLPEVATTPSNINMVKSVCLFMAVGFAFAIVVLFLFYYFDTTIKTAEQIESKIDVPVLGSIPDYNKKKKRGRK